jgi:hypothetical protein
MKAHHTIPALVLIILACACNQDQHRRRHKDHKQKVAGTDTLFVTKRSAISVWLDTATLEKRRKQYGDEAFEVGSDDDVYYSSITDSVLKSHQLPVIDTKRYKYIKFIQNNKAFKTVKIDTLPQVYTLYFFDPLKAPQDVDVTDIDNEYKNFYH